MRLIDADALKTTRSIQSADFNSIKTIREWIDNAPTAEVIDVEPKHGWWIKTAYGYWKCSVCEDLNTNGYFNYCPNCGAKMDEVK